MYACRVYCIMYIAARSSKIREPIFKIGIVDSPAVLQRYKFLLLLSFSFAFPFSFSFYSHSHSHLTLISLSRILNSESDYYQRPPDITYPRADPIITRKVK